MSEQDVDIHICWGSSSPTCKCECPDGPCEHQWDGEPYEGPGPFGDGYCESATCSKCGMPRINHDMWCGP